MTILTEDLSALGRELAGDLRRRGHGSELITPGDGRYEGARHLWNGLIDRRPALIARCATPHDVALTIGLARDRGLPLAVRGGGHSQSGHSMCDGGVVADLSPMRRVDVDPAARTIRAGGGALLEDLARAGQQYGLVVPAGHISHTGLGGIATGGGLGWYHRQFGLTIDSMVSAQVATADGEVLECSEDSEPELFWAIRGGGGNFGVVTEFRFRAHELGPTVLAGALAFTPEQAPEAIAVARALEELHPELQTYQVLTTAPPAPPFPGHLQGGRVCMVTVTWSGGIAEGQAAVAMLRDLQPAVDLVAPMPYLAVQFMIDDTAPPGLPTYARSHWLREFSDGPVEAAMEAWEGITSPLGAIICARMGGKVAEVPADATAFGHRDAHSLAWIVSPYFGGDGEPHRGWVTDTWDALSPWRSGVYVNALSAEDGNRVRDAYPPATWERLVAAKDRYDPENVFRLNSNVPPSGS